MIVGRIVRKYYGRKRERYMSLMCGRLVNGVPGLGACGTYLHGPSLWSAEELEALPEVLKCKYCGTENKRPEWPWKAAS
jgi:hypothetical protein